jgi:protease I
MPDVLRNQKVLLVIARTGVQPNELHVLKAAFESRGSTTVVATTAGGDALDAAGHPIRTHAITEVRTGDYAGAVLLGSGFAQSLWESELVHKPLRMFVRDEKPVGAIGLSVVTLAKGGLLTGKRATVWVSPDSLRALKEAGVHYEKRPVVVDGGLATADGPDSAERFAAVFQELIVQSLAKNRTGRLAHVHA